MNLTALLLAAAFAPPAGDDRGPITVSPEAAALHRTLLVADGHNDLPWAIRTDFGSDFSKFDLAAGVPALHTDIPRLRAGGVGLQFWSVYVPAAQQGAATAVFEQIAIVNEMVRRHPETFALCRTAEEVEAARAEGKIASLIGMEGGHALENSIGLLTKFREAGAAYLTLTHSATLDWADSATDEPKSDGLSPFGVEVVREMNRVGMLVDLSHVSAATMHDALDVTAAPVIFSHSSARAVANHPRNVPDDVLRRLRENGGVVMANFYSAFVVPEFAAEQAGIYEIRRQAAAQLPDDEAARDRLERDWRQEHPVRPGTIHDVLDHLDHLAKIAGPEHVGLGGDYDGVSTLPAGLEDVSAYPRLTQGLLDRGYSEDQIRGIMGENALRVLRAALAVGERAE
ncbi:dipeptidase [Alienimonas californiensis]|uniref:Membrane dipeptidase (Peptidase family M19) n=1 Tax=Alienimonas californiensis TaxID=2527989 RepID=A0A517P5V9_9PLAN|nr:dipeptidase [Alienimonas californiensis]QDT14761.1 Membrane dipeptidase (Peptidase family M19) [Alienimonas californiensis]